MNTYQGGIPISTTRYGPYQRGSGFFSSMRRFLTPLAKTALPHLTRAIGDVVSGESSVGQSIKTHGVEAGKDMLNTLADTVSGTSRKNYKRKAPPKKGNQSKKSRWA